ncbi:MAG: hypothetical protein ACD_75C00886G0001 [uncultured bacterium]|nr:MAG: hypothetical protein ACD_75C00886G0001 [uncultured bacterium]
MDIGRLGRLVAVRVDHHQPATFFPGGSNILPEMDIGYLDIDAPGNNQFGIRGVFRRASRGIATLAGPAGPGRSRADGLIELRSTQPVKQRVAGKPVDRPHIAGIGIG